MTTMSATPTPRSPSEVTDSSSDDVTGRLDRRAPSAPPESLHSALGRLQELCRTTPVPVEGTHRSPAGAGFFEHASVVFAREQQDPERLQQAMAQLVVAYGNGALEALKAVVESLERPSLDEGLERLLPLGGAWSEARKAIVKSLRELALQVERGYLPSAPR